MDPVRLLLQSKELEIRIETPFRTSQEKSHGPVATRHAVAPFSREGNRSDPAKAVVEDPTRSTGKGLSRLFGRPAPLSCYKSAYDKTLEKNAAGLLQSRIPFQQRNLFVDVEGKLVRLGFDRATLKTHPLMTLGPGGKMKHSHEIDEQQCMLMATTLWAVQHAVTFLF
jgi:hypothetical protein